MGEKPTEHRAGFKSMKESTREDWDLIVARYQPFAKAECAPLEFFEPMLRKVFSFPKNSIYRDTCQS